MQITIRRTGLLSLTLATDEGSSTLPTRCLRSGGTIRLGTTTYACTPTDSGWSLRDDAAGQTFTTSRSGNSSWSVRTPAHAFTLQQRIGRSAVLLNSAGDVAARLSSQGTSGLSVTTDITEVDTPTGVLAALTIMSRRRRAARFAAAIR